MPDSPPNDAGRRLVLVAGTGRSGTSTFVGALRRHGFQVPLPEVAADESNPRGFGEPRWVVDLHGRLLRQAKVQVADSRPRAWDMAAEISGTDAVRERVRGWLEEQFDASERLVVKDPRILWFLPLWTRAARDLGAEPSFVTMLRPPPETVGSRRTYYNRGLEDPHGIASWLNLMAGTEHATRGQPRSFVRYHDLLDDWAPVIRDLWVRNGLGEVPPTPSQDPGEFIDPGLRRQRLTWDDLELPERLESLTTAAAAAFDVLASSAGDEDDAVLGRLDEIRATYDAYYAEAESVAHSSVIAARQAGRNQPPPGRVPGPDQQPAPTRRGLAGAVAGKLPPSVRRSLSERLRARRSTGGS